jgi:hypothetical protein
MNVWVKLVNCHAHQAPASFQDRVTRLVKSRSHQEVKLRPQPTHHRDSLSVKWGGNMEMKCVEMSVYRVIQSSDKIFKVIIDEIIWSRECK